MSPETVEKKTNQITIADHADPLVVTHPAQMMPPPGFNASQIRLWGEIVPLLVESGTLSLQDKRALIDLVRTEDEVNKLSAIIEREGMIIERLNVKTGQVSTTANPAISARADAQKRLRNILSDFGMNPGARIRTQAVHRKAPPKEVIIEDRDTLAEFT